MNKLTRTLTPEIRILSATDKTVSYIASDESLDSYREVIAAKGWRFTNFKKNAPFVDSHDYSTIEKLLGSVVDFAVRGGQLIETVQWAADASPLASLGWKMTESGHLRAVSVGFFPQKMAGKRDTAAFMQAVSELKLPPEVAAKCEAIYLEQEQIELSSCIIGANPNALAKAHTEGAVKDGDLAACGFGDDDMAFLHSAARIFDEATPALRLLLDREIARIPFRKTTAAPAATSSTQRDAEDEANARRELQAMGREISRSINSLK